MNAFSYQIHEIVSQEKSENQVKGTAPSLLGLIIYELLFISIIITIECMSRIHSVRYVNIKFTTVINTSSDNH